VIGNSPAFQAVRENLKRFARYDAPVLIEGETGTGKELAARAIHYESARCDGPFVPVNCGALPEFLIENELFGHRRGAFTDARTDAPGLVELADSGTLFLDEVDALTPKAQVALLRFLQDQQYRPVGGGREKRADVRVITASNRELAPLCERGEFRLDLLFRLKLFHLRLPTLHERRGDARLLAQHFVETAAKHYGKARCALSAQTLEWFERYRWPGNVRELENLVYREFLLCDTETIHIPPPAGLDPLQAAPDDGLPCYRDAKAQAIAAFEVAYLDRVMRHAEGNVSAAARLIGTERRHLGRLLKKYNIVRHSA
jgi:DNA-binding NtrC family response regulator